METHFLNNLRSTFRERASRPALLYQGRTHSYAELERQARNGAAYLHQRGMQPGDRVVLWTSAKLSFLRAHLSILFGGGVSVPLNPRFPAAEIQYFLTDGGARLAVVGPDQHRILQDLLPQLPDLQAIILDEALATAPDATSREVWPDAQDPCLIVYSSGTTGWPKGVVHSHFNLAASLHALGDCWRLTPEDIVVNVLPLFHVHGLSFATHLSLLTGGCVLLGDAFDAQRTLDVVALGTVFMAVPTIYYRFLEQPDFVARRNVWENIRLCTCGSAPIRPEVLPRLEAILGRPVINRYGMTEAHVITSLPLDGPWPQGSVGLPVAGIELRVVGEDGQPVGVGTVGRVRVRGPNLFREYWRQPEATRQAFASGWFETGDLGMLDQAGFLTLVGRSNDLIITNGYNVYPQVVERVLNECPRVRESAVLGIPDERRGESVIAVVVRSDPELDEDSLRTYWSERLVDYQRPARAFFVDELPRNALGKVLRAQLREQVVKGLLS